MPNGVQREKYKLRHSTKQKHLNEPVIELVVVRDAVLVLVRLIVGVTLGVPEGEDTANPMIWIP
jgi:hypothetical protein